MSKKSDKICIIGNGASILQHKVGDLIDSFDVVARVNNFSVTGYEEFVGSKTDIWFNGANQKLKKRALPKQTVVLIPSSILERKGDKIHKRVCKRLGVENSSRYLLVDKENMKGIENSCKHNRITTGTAAIIWAMNNYKEVHIHGFDFFINSKSHYNDNFFKRFIVETGIIKKAEKHDTEKEKSYIDLLIEKNQIFRLVK